MALRETWLQMTAISNELSRQKSTGKIRGFSMRWGADSKKSDVTIDLHVGGVREEIFEVAPSDSIETLQRRVIDRINMLTAQ